LAGLKTAQKENERKKERPATQDLKHSKNVTAMSEGMIIGTLEARMCMGRHYPLWQASIGRHIKILYCRLCSNGKEESFRDDRYSVPLVRYDRDPWIQARHGTWKSSQRLSPGQVLID
jgi:hypothetical protein